MWVVWEALLGVGESGGCHCLLAFMPCRGCEVKTTKNAFFGLVALILPFGGFFDGNEVWGALPGSGGRFGSHPCCCSGAPAVIGPVDGHLGV